MQAETQAATGRKTPAVVHVDLDGGRQIYRHHGWEHPWEDDPLFETGMTNLLAFLARHELSATLFCIADDLDEPRKRALLEREGRG